MKKITLGILSVLMVVGGLFLFTGCNKQISISVSTNEFTISTNDTNAENYLSKDIYVSLTNSSAGVRVEVIEGDDSIHVDSEYATQRSDGEYYFTVYADKSGEAKIRVTAVDDSSKSEEITVHVQTMLTGLTSVTDDEKSLYLVRGSSRTFDDAFVSQFLKFTPEDANIKDIVWTILTGSSDSTGSNELVIGGITYAEIIDNTIYISEECDLSTIELRATFVGNSEVYTTITFAVLDDTTIASYRISDADGEVVLMDENTTQNEASFELKRNFGTNSTLTGTLVLNTTYDVSLSLVVLQQVDGVWQIMEDYSSIFSMDSSRNVGTSQTTFTFNINAYDDTGNLQYGTYKFYFQINYADYNYSVTTESFDTQVKVSYSAERIDLTSSDGQTLNGNEIDVFSSYENSNGYLVKVLVEPTEVALDDSMFYISLDTSQISNFSGDVSDYFTIYVGNITYNLSGVNGDIIYKTDAISNNASVYILASSSLVQDLTGVVINFVSCSTSAVSASLTLNLYKITDGELNVESYDVETGESTEVETQYISTNLSSNTATYTLKISGISSISGLELVSDGNELFTFSSLTTLSSSSSSSNTYVIFTFTVTINGKDFESETNFWFEHVTGKTTAQFTVSAFMPVTSVSISNGNASSTNVFISRTSTQSYVAENNSVSTSSTISNTSLSHLLIEAGAILPLISEYQTLSNNGISFSYLSFDSLVDYIQNTEGGTAEEAQARALEIFNNDNLEYVLNNLYTSFSSVDAYNSYFSITESRLTLTENVFKGYILATFSGYDVNHDEVLIVRIFAIESFYSVSYISPSIREKLLYTTETLSISDLSLSYVDITLSFRSDIKTPTYTDSLEYFTFTSAQDALSNATVLTSGAYVTTSDQVLSNNYYTISNVQYTNSGRYLKFTITANSTNLQTYFEDVLTITYTDPNGLTRSTQITIQIRNVNRVESVTWTNSTEGDEIYLDLTSSNTNDKTATISTVISPSDANDKTLSYYFLPTSGNSGFLNIVQQGSGETFNLSIVNNTETGGVGYLYILPTDMIKSVDGETKILLYIYSTDSDGNIVEETPTYIDWEDLPYYYDYLISDGTDSASYGNVATYFLNNDGEKIYYSQIFLRIKVTVADGLTEETALRIYSVDELKAINTAKYYQIMNNLTLNNWTSFSELSGMIFGADETITLTFTGSSDNFVTTNKGTIKNLTFAGQVTTTSAYSGFVADENSGTIENVYVDVYYSSNGYSYSTLTTTTGSGTYVGGLVGSNTGKITNSFVLGLTISATNATYIGGLVGQNSGTISGSGVEFYKFESGYNTITGAGNTYFGGIVGQAESESSISTSYVYAYPLTDLTDGGDDYSSILNGMSSVSLFVGYSNGENTIDQSFAFLGSLSTTHMGSGTITFSNSYYLYCSSSTLTMQMLSASYNNSYINVTITKNSDGVSVSASGVSSWETLLQGLNSSIWVTSEIDEDVNFGFVYLSAITQTIAVDIRTLVINDIEESYIQALAVDSTSGILFYTSLTQSTNTSAEESALTARNTISYVDLFNLSSSKQARTLLLSTTSSLVSINTNDLLLNGVSTTAFEVTVYSKMDFTSSKTFTFVVLNNLPSLNLTLNDNTISDGSTILLQTGSSSQIVNNLDSRISLNGTMYTTENDYTFDISYTDDIGVYISISKNSSNIFLEGLKVNGDDIEISSFITLSGLSETYNSVINEKTKKSFNVTIYDGARTLELQNSQNVTFTASQYAEFDFKLTTDNSNDNLTFALTYGDITLEVVDENGDALTFDKDTSVAYFKLESDLLIKVTWSKSKGASDDEQLYHVVVKVDDSCLHLVEENYYGMTLTVTPLSQMASGSPSVDVTLNLETQSVNDVSIHTYSIASRSSVRNVTYYTISDAILNTISPSSDVIVAVTVSPAYALMSYFTITYSATGDTTSGTLGTLSISRLSSGTYGYYINSANTTFITNGLRVNLTDDDKKGDGVYYFRVYVSSSFTIDSDIKITVNFYDQNNNEIYYGSTDLNVNYLQEAQVKVDGESTHLLAKGDSATITVTVGLDQTLYNLYTNNVSANIDISPWTMEVQGNVKVYTATVTAYVDAELSGGDTGIKDTGIFYICADVQRVINGTQEIKQSKATVCLVDFTVDANNISVNSTGAQATYNGFTADVFNLYLGSTDILSFNYPIIPESYIYDSTNPSEVAKVNELLAKQSQFEQNNYYADENSGYYINYSNDQGLTLKQQLSYVTSITSSGDSTSHSIYNGSTITENDYFNIIESENSGRTLLQLTGKRTGYQLMKLRTTIVYANITYEYDYYFYVVVSVYSDEYIPTQITTAEEFVDYLTNSDEADDYILMNDIVLTDYTPLDTDLVSSLDGNGYTIHINSFAYPEDSSTLSLALFDTVSEDTTLKNVRVNIYSGGQIYVDVQDYSTINIAGFAITNNGIIYNCEVISYMSENQSVQYTTNGIVVNFTIGDNTDSVLLTEQQISQYNLSINIAGFVCENTASITNSRVGGDSYREIVTVGSSTYLQSKSLGTFTIVGQGNVSGFVGTNSGSVSASFAKSLQIYNQTKSTTSQTAGFVMTNSGNVQGSYVESVGDGEDVQNQKTNLSTMGIAAGFVYTNSGLVKNSYSNIAIANDETYKPYLASGFVYINQSSGQITLCYSASYVDTTDGYQMPFTGVDAQLNSLNEGTITKSYYFNSGTEDNTNQSSITTGVTAVNSLSIKNTPEDDLYGFTFASSEDAYDGIWTTTSNGITLVSANQIAFSNRYAVTVNNMTYIYYTSSILEASTLELIDISYGSINNPIILRDAYDFAVATGDATSTPISAYQAYYSDTSVFGNYRVVNDIDMSEIDLDISGDGAVKLTTTEKTFTGLLDGNGFTISNINLRSDEELENFGLFAKLNGAVIMNVNFTVGLINDTNASIVGALAGTAVDSKLVAISVSPLSSEEDISVTGYNIVGGVVGMIFGASEMHDITASNMVIESTYNGTKYVGANDDLTGDTLRGYVSTGLKAYVSALSYAGALVGYVDIYDTQIPDYVRYDNSLEVSDFGITTVYVTDSVDIYGQVVGGLFGYVGESTYIFDAGLELDANMSGDNPSYITSKNLYAGGLIGENYGGLFAVYATYSEDLQSQIESSEYSYYNSSSSVERGQQNIFSYKKNIGTDNEDGDNVLYVGGLVGYMGGGFISVAYSKINVISDTAEAVGGIIGLAGNVGNSYELTFTNNTSNINIFLYDVYASGDLYTTSENGISGGIIGAIRSDSGNIPIIALKDVMAMNYYSVEQAIVDNASQTVLSGGEHYMLIGKIYSYGEDGKTEIEELNNRLYILDSSSDYFDVYTSTSTSVGYSSNTVGGYSNVIVSGSQIDLAGYFGFSNDASTVSSSILQATSIGSLSSMDLAYVRFNSYFLENDWQSQYWEHTQSTLFPYIDLTSNLDTIYWDVYNTEEVLAAIENNPSITVIVRGRVSESENNAEWSDIDLTSDSAQGSASANFKTLSTTFSGTLISYYAYVQSHAEGYVTNEVYHDTTLGKTLVGGDAGSDVGLILDESLFEFLSNATIQGLNIYLVESGSDVIDYNLFKTVEDSVIRDVNIVLNNNVSIEATSFGSDSNGRYAAGLITNHAESTSFVNISFTARNESSITFTTSSSSTVQELYYGLLAGYIEQESAITSTTIQGVSVISESGDGLVINLKNTSSSTNVTLYAGVFAGSIVKSGAMRSTLYITTIDDVQLNIASESETVYVGGVAGYINGVTQISVSDSSSGGNGMKILQSENVGSLYAGIAFGAIYNTQASIEGVSLFVLKGGIYQATRARVKKSVYIGGLVGYSNSNIVVQSFSVDLTVANEDGTDDTEFDKNYKEYTVNSFIVNGDSQDNAIGGIVGYSVSGTVYVSGDSEISGAICVSTESTSSDGIISVGGLIGKINEGLTVNASIDNSINISVKGYENDGTYKAYEGYGTAYVGGVVGWVQVKEESVGSDSTEVTISINDSESSYGYVQYTGNVISDIKTLIFGGVFGYVSRTDYKNSENSITIKRAVFGGAVKAYGYNLNSGSLTVGGIVGEFDVDKEDSGDYESVIGTESSSAYTISNCYSYGNIFICYNARETTESTTNDPDRYDTLNTYNFGGIVGKASYIDITNSYSLMTNFNIKVTNDTSNYKVGAVVGANSDLVKYQDNYYSSGVCMAYQEESGNVDAPYGASVDYMGYTTVVETTDTSDIMYSTDILEYFNIGGDLALGSKLNPLTISEAGKSLTTSTSELIKWYAVTTSIDGLLSSGSTLSDAVIVGNGQTITISDSDLSSERTSATGALFNAMGTYDRYDLAYFSAITGLVIELDIQSYDISSNYFGGVVGYMYDNSFIYGVAVKGELSVGVKSKGSSFKLAGIAGNMCGGMISDCYVDATITYRGGDGDNAGVAGIALYYNSSSGWWQESTIKSTYSAGLIEVYYTSTSNEVYTFAAVPSLILTDCYSIANVQLTSISGDTETPSVKFAEVSNSRGSSFDLYTRTDTWALAYNKEAYSDQKINPDSSSSGYTTWYFNPYVNYGYASHGFGYLKNVTAYTRKISNPDDLDDGSTVVTEYEYTAVSYLDVLTSANVSEWFLGVPNAQKFQQMLDVIETGSASVDDQDWNFVILYDIDMSSKYLSSDTNSYINKNIGSSSSSSSYTLTIDGANHTLDFSSLTDLTSPLFDTVYGTIENLRLNDINVSGAQGTLATTFVGYLTNITVVGSLSLSTSSSLAGGVVGTLNGNATAVYGVVNVTSNNVGIVGGVVGQLTSGRVSYSSNAGEIVATGSTSLSSASFLYINSDGEITGSESSDSFNLIAGGVVGYASSGTTVDNSYNENAVLANYTNANTNANSVAGGIVGYSAGATIENSYNTGTIGAGNYSSEYDSAYNYAGGIFGYGTGGTSVRGCINDGAVEAIGKMDTTKYEIEGEVTSGEADAGYNPEPKCVIVKYTITYNGGENRHVYAYGIGFIGGDGSIEDCSTSTDNIKNDGNIGEVSDTQYMKFDRKTMLDQYTLNGENMVTGKFSLSDLEEFYINGYDAYGMPARIYLEDTMTRRMIYYAVDYNTAIATIDNSTSNNRYANVYDVENNILYDQNSFGNNTTVNSLLGQIIESYYDESDESDESYVVNVTEVSQLVYYLAADTTYYSSVSFVQYESILDGTSEDISLLGYVAGEGSMNITEYDRTNGVEIDGEPSTIEEKISDIDEMVEDSSDSLVETTINGQSAAIVKNKSGLISAIAPYYIDFDFEVTIDDTDFVEANSEVTITWRNSSTNAEVSAQYTSVTTSYSDSTLKVSGTSYFGEAQSNLTATVTVSYQSSRTITLSKNNVFDYGDGQIKILLDYYSEIDDELLESWNEYKISYTLQSTSSDDDVTDLTLEFELEYDDTDGYYLIGDQVQGGKNLLNVFSGGGYSLIINYVSTTTTENADISVKTTTKTYEVTLEDTNNVVTFKEYSSGTLRFILTDSFVESSDNSYTLDLSDLLSKLNGTTKLAFGNDSYSVTYNGEEWKVSDDADDGISISVDDSSGVLTITADSATSDDLQEFINNMLDWTVYYNLMGEFETSALSNSVEYCVEENLRYTLNYNISGSGNFGVEENVAIYYGSDINSEEVNVLTDTYFGVEFYTYEVEYTYKLEGGTLNITEGTGYEIQVKDGDSLVAFLQGAGSLSISSDYIKNGYTLSITLNSNEYSCDESDDEAVNEQWKFLDTLSLTVESEDGATKKYYTVTKEEVVDCSYCDEECTAVTTSWSVVNWNDDETASVAYQYEYTIYSCGAISVEYYVLQYNATTGTELYFITAEKYDYYDNSVKAYSYRETIIGESEDIEITWEEDSSLNTDLSVFEKISLGEYDISVDVVVADYDEKNIYFARNDYNTLTSNGTIPADDTLTLSSFNIGYSESETLKNSETTSYSYRVDGESSYTSVDESGATLTYDEDTPYEEVTYEILKITEEPKTMSGLYETTGSSDSSGSFIYIVLKNDISIGDYSFDANDKNYIGNNYVLRYSNSVDGNNFGGLFNSNSASISNLVVVGSVKDTASPSRSTRNSALLIYNNSGSLSNIKVYGTFRNIYSYSGTTYVLRNSGSGKITNLESSVTLYGLDGADGLDGKDGSVSSAGNDVERILSDLNSLSSTDTFESYNIIIAGSGGNGGNGSDGSTAGSDGGAGKQGGQGGSIEVQSEGTFCRSGIGGISGYGGNGANGSFSNGSVTGGGGGGRTFDNGDAGTLTVADSDGTDSTRTSYFDDEDDEDDEKTQFGGNGGIGGLGRYYYYYISNGNSIDELENPSSYGAEYAGDPVSSRSDPIGIEPEEAETSTYSGGYFYTSGGGGGAGGTSAGGKGGDGKALNLYYLAITKTNWYKEYAWLKLYGTAYKLAGDFTFDANSYSGTMNHIKNNIYNNFSGLTLNNGGLGGTGGSAGNGEDSGAGGQVQIRYIFSHVVTYRTLWPRDLGIAWNSGETVNSAGSFGSSGVLNPNADSSSS